MDPPTPATKPLLAAMVTPAVLISAAGTLEFSTTSRLARIVDRARVLGLAAICMRRGLVDRARARAWLLRELAGGA